MLDRNTFARTRAGLIGLATLGCLALAPAIAQAGVSASSVPNFPSTVTVGDVGKPATITLKNQNDMAQAGLTNRVCNNGDPAPCAGAAETGIILTPSCKELSTSGCTAAGADPGVFRLSATGKGTAIAGNTCAGVNFTIAVVDATFGTVRFSPPAGTNVSLPGGNGASCEIGFTFDVLKSPVDQDPSTPGVQTGQLTDNGQCAEPCLPGALVAQGRGTVNGTTVVRAAPQITTIASPAVAVNGQLTDQATVSNLVNPVAGAAVTFRLYPPSSPSCTPGSEVFTDLQIVTLAGPVATATSAAYQPKVSGVYHWVATYGGDANNMSVTGACGEATETRTVPPPGTPPPVCTTPPGPAPAGGVLCARGTAAIRGRTGCAGSRPFKVVVSGRQIQSVTFAMDGKVVRRLSKPNSGSRFSLPINPPKLRRGVHRVVARTIFRKQSATKARTLRVTFSKCSRRASAPAFTG
jgi:hypothetical protein